MSLVHAVCNDPGSFPIKNSAARRDYLFCGRARQVSGTNSLLRGSHEATLRRLCTGAARPGGFISEHLPRSIDYLNRRESFLTKSAISVSVLLALAGAVFALALSRGQDALFHVVISFAGQPLLVWEVLRMQRNYERRRSRVNEILADMNAV